MRVMDLSHPISGGMPVWPGDPAAALERVSDVERDGFQVTRLTLGSHTGTHMDAPGHVLPGGATLDSLPPGTFVGTAAVTRGFPSLEELSALEGVDFLLFSTGWEGEWGKPAYFSGYPVPPRGILERIVHMGLKGVGMDTPSPDVPDRLDHHRLLLGAGLVVVENLTGLAALAGQMMPFCALPPPFRGSDGGPVRALAFLDDQMEE